LTESPRWQRRPAERHREILEAAIALFGEQGFDGATLADVADRAGVSAGTVTHYFGSKGGLFEAALNDRFLNHLTDDEALLAIHQGSSRELLAELLTRMWHALMTPGTVDLILFGLAQAQGFPEACGLMCRELGERRRRLLGAVLTAGIQRGEFRTVDVALQARVITAGLLGLMLHVHHFSQFESVRPTHDQLFAQFLETIDHSLALEKSSPCPDR
jgi:AcrR family transcriptional regulator